MRITQEADYALRIAYKLASVDKICDAKTISAETCVTLRFALKILRKFVLGGIAVSFKGVNGGYKLAKKPSEITLCDIIKLIDGPCDISRCLSEEHICSKNGFQKENCAFHLIFSKISKTIEQNLNSITFEDLLKSGKEKEHLLEKIQ